MKPVRTRFDKNAPDSMIVAIDSLHDLRNDKKKKKKRIVKKRIIFEV